MICAFVRNGHEHYRIQGEKGPRVETRVVLHPSQMKLIERFVAGNVNLRCCSITAIPETEDPETVLDALSAVHERSDVDGLRKPIEAELFALKMAELGVEGIIKLDSIALSVLENHPAVTGGCGFAFPHGIPLSFFLLLREIYDIRRFVDSDNPFRLNRMKRYFRLLDTSALACTDAFTDTNYRSRLAFQGWYMQPLSLAMSLQKSVVDVPRAFLFRDYLRYRTKLSDKPDNNVDILAAWHVTIRFLFFLKAVWYSAVGGPEFIPEKFFSRRDESDSFRAYINPVDNQLDNHKFNT